MKKEERDSLIGYKEVKGKEYSKIQAGDRIRYFIDGAFRKGGFVKALKYPDYIVCMNPISKVTWCIQLKNPTLITYIMTKADRTKTNKEKEKIYKAYKEGTLVKQTKRAK